MTWNLRQICRRNSSALLACLLAFSAAYSYAGIVNSSNVTLLGGPPPPGVHPDDQVTPIPIFFQEVAGGVVPLGGLPVDHDGSDVFAVPVETSFVVHPDLDDVVLPVGTLFDSYLFHFDPENSFTPSFYDSTITFSTPIIGVQLFSGAFTALQKPAGTDYVGTLEDGDSAVALNGGPPLTYYPGNPSPQVDRGQEEDAMGIDFLGGYRIRLAGQDVGTEIDQVRVFVAVVPEPTSAALLAMGLLGLLFSGITRVGKVCRS